MQVMSLKGGSGPACLYHAPSQTVGHLVGGGSWLPVLGHVCAPLKTEYWVEMEVAATKESVQQEHVSTWGEIFT